LASFEKGAKEATERKSAGASQLTTNRTISHLTDPRPRPAEREPQKGQPNMTSKTTTKATSPKTNGKQSRKKSYQRAAKLIYGSAIKTYGNP